MNTTDNTKQIVKNLINSDVYVNQSSLIDDLLTVGYEFSNHVMGYENVTNLDVEDEENPGEYVAQEIFEWWSVSQYLADELEKVGAPVINSDMGNWYGRTETGQSLEFDHYLNQVAHSIEIRTTE